MMDDLNYKQIKLSMFTKNEIQLEYRYKQLKRFLLQNLLTSLFIFVKNLIQSLHVFSSLAYH